MTPDKVVLPPLWMLAGMGIIFLLDCVTPLGFARRGGVCRLDGGDARGR
jgi:hypothetical protein